MSQSLSFQSVITGGESEFTVCAFSATPPPHLNGHVTRPFNEEKKLWFVWESVLIQQEGVFLFTVYLSCCLIHIDSI